MPPLPPPPVTVCTPHRILDPDGAVRTLNQDLLALLHCSPTNSLCARSKPLTTRARRSPSPRSSPPSCIRNRTRQASLPWHVTGQGIRNRTRQASMLTQPQGARRTCRGCPHGSPSPCRCLRWQGRLGGAQAQVQQACAHTVRSALQSRHRQRTPPTAQARSPDTHT
jgi:hypothetical protein